MVTDILHFKALYELRFQHCLEKAQCSSFQIAPSCNCAKGLPSYNQVLSEYRNRSILNGLPFF